MTQTYHLILPGIKPFSTNSAYYKRTFTMTADCREWRKTVIKALKSQQNQTVMDEIRDAFLPHIHGLVVSLTYHMNYVTYYTKSGDISARSMDLSNVEKLLIDIIFDSRFYDRKEINNCNINDKYILNLHSKKVPATFTCVEVTIDMFERQSLTAFKDRNGGI